jgi:hypothetical protein
MHCSKVPLLSDEMIGTNILSKHAKALLTNTRCRRDDTPDGPSMHAVIGTPPACMHPGDVNPTGVGG